VITSTDHLPSWAAAWAAGPAVSQTQTTAAVATKLANLKVRTSAAWITAHLPCEWLYLGRIPDVRIQLSRRPGNAPRRRRFQAGRRGDENCSQAIELTMLLLQFAERLSAPKPAPATC
jgi:hypothetical protein